MISVSIEEPFLHFVGWRRIPSSSSVCTYPAWFILGTADWLRWRLFSDNTERMLPMILSGELPENNGRRVGKQAAITAMHTSTSLQISTLVTRPGY